MKKLLLSISLVLATVTISAQSVGINTETPDASAALDVTSTTQGMLIPRMTEMQLNAIAAPATGLMVYQTDGTAGFQFFNGTVWTSLNGGASATGGGGIMQVTEAQKNAMTTAANGTLVYQTDEFKGIYAKESDGWRSQSGDTPILLIDVATTTSPVTLNASHNIIYVYGSWNTPETIPNIITLPSPSSCKGRVYKFVVNNSATINYDFAPILNEFGWPIQITNANAADQYKKLDKDFSLTDNSNRSIYFATQRMTVIKSDGVNWIEIQNDKTDNDHFQNAE